MAKFYGNIGFAETVQTEPGLWEEQITVRPYFGDLNRNTRRLQNPGVINDDIEISNEISIVSDPYANENFHSMRYVEWMGTKWKVSNIEVQYPRLILTLGGLYTHGGEQAEIAE